MRGGIKVSQSPVVILDEECSSACADSLDSTYAVYLSTAEPANHCFVEIGGAFDMDERNIFVAAAVKLWLPARSKHYRVDLVCW